MRRLIVLGLLAAVALPVQAAKHVSVAQLEQAMAADFAAHRPDAEVAHRLGELELAERLSPATLERFATALPLGPRTALALQMLADQSAFLDPPASELPATAFPDVTEQKRVLDLARGYAVQQWPHMPNFFATRTTHRFDSSSQILEQGGWPVYAGLHPVGTVSRQIAFRDGQEVADAQAQPAATAPGQPQRELGLHTWGEFGPAVIVVLTDSAKGKLEFHHWERNSTGLAAVYRYEVPKAISHYSVNYCCFRDVTDTGGPAANYGDRGRGGTRTSSYSPHNVQLRPFSEAPGYHGLLSIDPVSGAILRLTLEAELSAADPLLRAAIAIEYAPVKIGEASYLCPVRSLALSMEDPSRGGAASLTAGARGQGAAWQSAPPPQGADQPVVLVNETTFASFHRLGSTLRLVTEEAASTPNPASGAPTAPPAAETPAITPEPPPQPAAAQAAPPPAPVPQPAAEPVLPEVDVSAANGVPDLPAADPQSQQGGFTLKLSSRLVDVGIVAYDKKGRAVRDLTAEDFEVYDEGRRQQVRFFSEFASPAPAPVAEATAHSFSNRAAADAAPLAVSAPEASATILLVDESHIAWSDLAHARQEILKFLTGLAPGERVGLYVITRTGFRVLTEITADHAAVTAALKKWAPSAQAASQAQDEEMRNRQQFNEVHSAADLNSVNGNQADVPDSQSTVDPMLRSMGSDPARQSLLVLTSVARHLSAAKGHKSLVWVSSDNVFADWRNQAVAIDKGPRTIDPYAVHAQEAMNEAHVAVFPFDVSQLEGGAIEAGVRTRNVELTQAAMDTATVSPYAGQAARNAAPGRITAQMQQDMHPIQGPIRQVAEATGGRIIRRSGDLAGELAQVVEDGHAVYLVSFTPQGPADGRYHGITVKLAGKHPGITLRYRTGYMFDKEPGTLKERFQQAVWRSADAGEISVSAEVTPMAAGGNVKLSITTAELNLEERGGRWMDKLDIFFIQRDDTGQHAQVEGQTLGLRLKPSTYRTLLPGAVPFERFVQLHPGASSLRVLVVDENSGRMGSATIPAAALEGVH